MAGARLHVHFILAGHPGAGASAVGQGEGGERMRGLDEGADDYLTEPFALAEPLARLGDDSGSKLCHTVRRAGYQLRAPKRSP